MVDFRTDILKDFIASVDKDGSGTIDAKELLAATKGWNIDEEMIEEFIAKHDKDGDGALSLKELEAFMKTSMQ